jgi:uncharacterized protein (UPF0248 family)
MSFPRDILNELKWREGLDLREAVITYRHRGAPGDVRTISGNDIEALQHSFFITESGTIPYHRILRIDHRGRTLFESGEME